MSRDVVTKDLYDYIKERIVREVEADLANNIPVEEEAELLKKECDELLKRIDKERKRINPCFTSEEYAAFVKRVKIHCTSRRRFR